MSFKMGAVIAGGVFGGRYLDGLAGLSFPLMTILLSLLGVVMAIVVLVRDTSH
jgi:F0F1-type ATP synthase assembly protein I